MKNYKLQIPSYRDTEWLQLTVFIFYVAIAATSPSFNRTLVQFSVTLGTCFVFDLFLNFFFAKKREINLPSRLIMTLAIFILVDSSSTWIYGLAPVIALSAQYFLLVKQRLCFQPVSFALVASVLFLSPWMSIEAGRWGSNPIIEMLIFGLGLFVTYRNSRLNLAFSYGISLFLCAIFRAFVRGVTVSMVTAPMTSATLQIFVIYLLADPVGSPRSKRQQILFGFLIAVVDSLLRHFQFKNAPILSLFAMSAIFSMLREAPQTPVTILNDSTRT